MNKKKIIADITMTLIFVLIIDTFFTGILLHEALGIAVAIVFVIHHILNLKWIKGVSKNFFGGIIPLKTKIMYILNILLFISCGFTILSGILISQELFKFIALKDTFSMSVWHHFSSYVSLILLSIHLGLHWNMVMNAFRKMFNLKEQSPLRKIILRILSFGMAVMGILSLMKTEVKNYFTAPFKNTESEVKANDSNILNKEQLDSFYENSALSKKDSYFTNLSIDSGDSQSLDDYLSHLVCQGCGKRCPLTALRCGRGQAYKEQAIVEYNQKKSTSKQSSSDEKQSYFDKDANSLDAVFIGSLFVCGTHYIITIPNKKRKNNV